MANMISHQGRLVLRGGAILLLLAFVLVVLMPVNQIGQAQALPPTVTPRGPLGPPGGGAAPAAPAVEPSPDQGEVAQPPPAESSGDQTPLQDTLPTVTPHGPSAPPASDNVTQPVDATETPPLEGAALQARATPGWTLEVDFTSDQLVLMDGKESARQKIQGFLDSRLAGRGISYEVIDQGDALQAKLFVDGDIDPNQLAGVLFDTIVPDLDLLGGPVEISITGSVSSGQNIAIALQGRPSAGYLWAVGNIEASKLVQSGNPVFEMQGPGIGTPSKETINLASVGDGETSIVLLFQRPWESSTAKTRRLSIRVDKLPGSINLVDPTPVLMAQATALAPSEAEPPLDAADMASLPTSFDWRSQGGLTDIRNQGGAGTCWSFGTVGLMESALKRSGLGDINLSEQYLVSCNQHGWNANSGGFWTAHGYHVDQLGLNQVVAGAVLEADKPYTGTDGDCTVAYNHPYQLTEWHYISGTAYNKPTDEQIKTAIYNYGPVGVSMCQGPALTSYSGGIFNTDESSYCAYNTNHAVILVGWNDSEGSWILRNSWGSYWGESGYMRIRRGVSNVGYNANYVIYGSACYTLTTSAATGGSISASPAANCNSGTQYTAGSVVQLTASADTGYEFTGWSGDASGTINPVSVTMNGNKSVAASFSQVCYSLDIKVDPPAGGDVSLNPTRNCNSGTQYLTGTVVELTPTVNDVWEFIEWSGDASGTSTNVSVTMDGNKTVTVKFRKPGQKSDYNGDGKADVGYYRDGAWYINGQDTVNWGGDPGDIPVPGDYNGDGTSDIGIYRDGWWYIIGQEATGWGGDPDDMPIPGDYDGDGKTDIGIYREGWWYIIGQEAVGWGGDEGDILIPGDYDGDGKMDIGIYRDGWWYVIGQEAVGWGGDEGDIPVPGDYNGDGKMDIGIYREGWWYIIGQEAVGWGGDEGDIPVPGDYNGDGRTQIGIYRQGRWYIVGETEASWGGSEGDIPLLRSPGTW